MNKTTLRRPTLTFEMASIMANTPWADNDMIELARRGDPSDLVIAVHDPDRPAIVDWLLSEHCFCSARSALRQVWSHDYQHCLSRWGTRGTVNRFEVTGPYETLAAPDLPPLVDVWRGCVSGSAPATQRLSWTLDRRVAAFFCFYHIRGRSNLPPHGLILHRRVRRSSILMYDNERSEAEVLLKPSSRFTIERMDWAAIEAMEADWRSSIADCAHEYPATTTGATA
jgi:hypothetical protein